MRSEPSKTGRRRTSESVFLAEAEPMESTATVQDASEIFEALKRGTYRRPSIKPLHGHAGHKLNGASHALSVNGKRPQLTGEDKAPRSLRHDWDALYKAYEDLRYDAVHGGPAAEKQVGGIPAYEAAVNALRASFAHTSAIPGGGNRILWEAALRNLASLEQLLILSKRGNRPVGDMQVPADLIRQAAQRYKAACAR